MIYYASPNQAKRFWKIATNPKHFIRPWMPDEVDRFLRHHGCVDFAGQASAERIRIFRNRERFYDWMCEVVAGPVPSYALETTYQQV